MNDAQRDRIPPLMQSSPIASYLQIRQATERLCAPLAAEDYVIQGMPDVSPPKWHLAHTTWFFENFVLLPFANHYAPFDARFSYLFNSYYQTVGACFPRANRGLLARPSVDEIVGYRRSVDDAMSSLLLEEARPNWDEIVSRTRLGLNHEQQHQELLLTDIKYNFALNPLRPIYGPEAPNEARGAPKLRWLDIEGGLRQIGADGSEFAFDNETPRHKVYFGDFRIASRLVTNGEYLEFLNAGGYRRPELWLSDGWTAARARNWGAPLYWEQIDGQWWQMTLTGFGPLNLSEPVCHVSFYEADAYARWLGRRLPSEAEWECAAADLPVAGNLRESGRLHPCEAPDGGEDALTQCFGDVWEWTQSSYAAYPGFKPLQGSLGEYNGKFMCNQQVLRGGSCVTPSDHVRATYRNFFYPADRWQFTGIRLAEDAI
jgi:ergothioneine biosynthesis protein EgtB